MAVSSISPTGTVAPTPSTLNVLVELVYWTAPDSVTPAQAQQQYDVTNNTWFYDASYGLMTEHGAATQWLPIAAPPDPDGSGSDTPCDNIGTIQSEADQTATASGYNPSAYSNVVYYYPTCAGEQWGGWGQVGGNRTWLIGEMDTRVAVHELGHNLGLNHSHSETCSLNGATVAYSSACTQDEYGDPVSAMGAGYSGQGMYAANQTADVGWLGSTGHGITTVTASGTYSLTPLESMPGGIQALKVTNSAGVEFWIEYRQPLNDDSFVWSGDTNGVLIHSADGMASNLYDMTPATAGTFTDAALPVGATWSDPTSTLSVSVNSTTSSGASVTVNLGTPPVTLSVSKTGTGSGTVTSSPAGINCGATCSAGFATGSSVTLTAAAAAGSTFGSWSGACTGMSASCTVTMNAAQSATASFNTTAGTRYEETAVQFEGWFLWSDPTANGGSWRTSAVKNNTASFAFSGTSVTWLSNKGPSRGMAAVTIDGVSKGTVDLYSATPAAFSKAFGGLSTGAHTILIKVTGTRNAASTGTGVVVDGFTVGTATTQENGKAIKYNTWKGATSVNASGGAYRSSGSAGAVAQLKFSGSSVSWVTAVGPGWGKAEVYIDNVDEGTVDLYASTAHWQTLKSYTGLAAGSHTIQVKVLGTKNALAKATTVPIDGFDVS